MSLRALDTKNLIKFYIRETLYYHALIGDDVINVFDRLLMNICLEQYHETLECNVSYDDICFISVMENNNITINDLPSRLSELYVSRSRCTTFSIPENTAENLKVLSLDYTNLVAVPVISHCPQLTKCVVTHSNISSFQQPIPKSLVELNLRWNVITTFDFALALQLQKLDLNNNYFKKYNIIEGNGRTFTYIQQESYKHTEIKASNAIVNIHVNIQRREEGVNIQRREEGVNIQRREEVVGGQEGWGGWWGELLGRRDNNSELENAIFSSQSVHLSSINISVNKSIGEIKKWIREGEFIVHETSISEIIKHIADRNVIRFLTTAFDCEKKHSLTQYTYHNIFDLVWCVAMNHKDKLDIIVRITTEVSDSIGMCFTGRINRIVNSLVGILECVNIGISTKEQLQLNVQRIVKRVTENQLDYIDGICEIKDLFINDTTNEKKAWLDAFKDYEPDVKIITVDRIIDGIEQRFSYELTYDNIILDRGVVIGSYEESTRRNEFFS